MNKNVKIFGVGLNKTGTSTLGKCLEILGYSHFGCSRDLLEDVVEREDYENVFRVVDQYDSFEDWPWPLIYRKLDKMFPGSKFILTIRKDENTWIRSLKKHSRMRDPSKRHCRLLAYGYNAPSGKEKEHLEIYDRHNKEIIDYFKERPNDLLVVCWEKGDGWEKICSFLDRKVPRVPFPHENKSLTIIGELIVWIKKFLSRM